MGDEQDNITKQPKEGNLKNDNGIKEEKKQNNQDEQINPDAKDNDSDAQYTKSDIQSLKEELAQANDRYLRVHADFENVKKRLEREKYQALEYANEAFSKDLLSVVDTLQAGIDSIGNDNKNPQELLKKVDEGLKLTIDSLYKTFEKYGIKEIEVDKDFNPDLHEALMHVKSEKHKDGQIVQLLQRGFVYKERVLRPAMVSICKNS